MALTEAQKTVLAEIDADLERGGVPIPFRGMRAMGHYARRYQAMVEGPLAGEIQAWFGERYGSRSNLEAMGRLPILIGPDVYEIRFTMGSERKPGGSRPVLQWAVEGGEGVRGRIYNREPELLQDLLDVAWQCLSELSPLVAERVLQAAATEDLDTALDELVRSTGPRPGLSKWASQQAAEKSLKEYLRFKGVTPPKTHVIADLHRLAVGVGLPTFAGARLPEGEILELIECSPGVRYGEEVFTVQEAVGAYYGSLIVCSVIAGKMRLEAGGKNWLAPGDESLGTFLIRRLCERGNIPHRLE